MNKIICAHCGRGHDVGHYDIKGKAGATVCILFLCDVCKSLMKSIDINFTVDDDKVQALKKTMDLSKKKPR